MTKLVNSTNFQNPAFAAIFDRITASMPGITFYGIVGTYLITAALNVHFIPLPYLLSIPAALAIQFGRFAVVFMDFLNPTGTRSPWPPIIALAATGAALGELWFSLGAFEMEGNELWAVYLFGSMVIVLGFLLEINFIAKGAEAFGMGRQRPAGAVSSPTLSEGNVQRRVTPPPALNLTEILSNGNGNGHH